MFNEALNETLQEIIDNYKDAIAAGNYKVIMKTIPEKPLALLLKALKEAEVLPFRDLPEKLDLEFFSDQLVDTGHRWITGFFARAVDGSQELTIEETLVIARVCAALGFAVYRTAQGYWGNEDYLITHSSRRLSDILADEALEDYSPSDFTEIKFTDLDLYA